MNEIKPIETRYNGYRFRSRLEARWAVFFDHLKIGYEYELEGLRCGNDCWLPDFFIPDMGAGLYVEIKPYFPDYAALLKLQKFSFSGIDILLISGTPEKEEFYLFSKKTITGVDRCEEIKEYFDEEKSRNENYWPTVEETIRDNWIHCNLVALSKSMLTGKWDLVQYPQVDNTQAYVYGALVAAKRARFEFGESG